MANCEIKRPRRSVEKVPSIHEDFVAAPQKDRIARRNTEKPMNNRQ